MATVDGQKLGIVKNIKESEIYNIKKKKIKV